CHVTTAAGTQTSEQSFFFQAEDGIRDKLVTGVQTCALPILRAAPQKIASGHAENLENCLEGFASCDYAQLNPQEKQAVRGAARRSEERRVGKECRSRRSAYE